MVWSGTFYVASVGNFHEGDELGIDLFPVLSNLIVWQHNYSVSKLLYRKISSFNSATRASIPLHKNRNPSDSKFTHHQSSK